MASVRSSIPHTTGLGADLQRATELLKAGRRDAAAALSRTLTDRYPDSPDAWLLACAVEQQAGRFDSMLAHAERAVSVAPGHPGAEFRLMECRLYCGRADAVIDRLQRFEETAADDHRLLCRIAEFYTHCVRHADALRCYRRAVELQPSNPAYLFSLSAVLTAAGRIDDAEAALDAVIALNPDDCDAYRNRATLRRQTADRNHIDEIRSRLERGVKRPAGEAQLCYALAKEYEDLGRYDDAFAMLARGAAKRRGLMRYRVESDLEAIDRIIDVFDAGLFENASAGHPEPGPIFVMGLPRSGTTLVDRILASHGRVASLGEVNDLAYALMRTAGGGGKLELIDKAAALDFGLLGGRYVESTRAYGIAADCLVDKTPLNYLYVGLIRLALPGARMVHVQRDPMDSCYGMYRTLFRAGYPFSYDLDDLARYYVAYTRLMAHWRDALPDAFLDLRYESLVDDQEGATRRLLEYCGLDWDAACLAFHRNPSPVATASSAQVRRPLYRDAVGRWRHYERQLQPLADRLVAAGIDIGT